MGRETKYNYKKEFIAKNNYIFYDRLSESMPQSLWNGIKERAEQDLTGQLNFLKIKNDREKLSDMLLAQSRIEQEKERNFLEQVFEIDINKIKLDDYPALINTLNQYIGLKDKYQYLLKVLDEGRGKTEAQKKSKRAYGAMAYFDSYLAARLSQNLTDALKSNKNQRIIIDGDLVAYNNFLDNMIEKSIRQTIEHISIKQTEKGIIPEEVHVWEEFLQILNATEKLSYGEFKSDLYQLYNLDKVKEEVRKFLTDKMLNSKNLHGLSATIRKSYDISTKGMRSVEGKLEEYTQSVMPGKYITGEKGSAAMRSGLVVKTDIAKTDSISLYTTNIDFDLTPLENELRSFNSSESLLKTQEYFNDFNKRLQKIPDTFIVYESTKKYANNSDNFRGFSGGIAHVRDLPVMFNKIGTQIDVDKLMTVLLNTMNGAMHQKNKDIRKDISHQLSAAVATFLFDDWENIGDVSNKQALHIFILDGVRVPLSFLLYAVGMAIRDVNNDPTSVIRFSFSLGDILYPKPIGSEGSDTVFDPSGGGMKKYWDEQRQKAREQATFTTHFMKNFNDIIKTLLDKL